MQLAVGLALLQRQLQHQQLQLWAALLAGRAAVLPAALRRRTQRLARRCGRMGCRAAAQAATARSP